MKEVVEYGADLCRDDTHGWGLRRGHLCSKEVGFDFMLVFLPFFISTDEVGFSEFMKTFRHCVYG